MSTELLTEQTVVAYLVEKAIISAADAAEVEVLTWNRDVNAAKNILMLTMFQMQGLARPLIFTNSVQLK